MLIAARVCVIAMLLALGSPSVFGAASGSPSSDSRESTSGDYPGPRLSLRVRSRRLKRREKLAYEIELWNNDDKPLSVIDNTLTEPGLPPYGRTPQLEILAPGSETMAKSLSAERCPSVPVNLAAGAIAEERKRIEAEAIAMGYPEEGVSFSVGIFDATNVGGPPFAHFTVLRPGERLITPPWSWIDAEGCRRRAKNQPKRYIHRVIPEFSKPGEYSIRAIYDGMVPSLSGDAMGYRAETPWLRIHVE